MKRKKRVAFQSGKKAFRYCRLKTAVLEQCFLPQQLITEVVMLQIREVYVMGLGLPGSVNDGEWTAGHYFGISREWYKETS